jgi:hypothetical protein
MIVNEIIPTPITNDRAELLHKIDLLLSKEEVDTLSEITHIHSMEDISDISLDYLANNGHGHVIEEFPIMNNIASSLAKSKHSHDINSNQNLWYEIEQTKNKIKQLKDIIDTTLRTLSTLC